MCYSDTVALEAEEGGYGETSCRHTHAAHTVCTCYIVPTAMKELRPGYR